VVHANWRYFTEPYMNWTVFVAAYVWGPMKFEREANLYWGGYEVHQDGGNADATRRWPAGSFDPVGRHRLLGALACSELISS